MSIKNMGGEYGMLYNYPLKDIERPCNGKCTITGITAGLEYPNGTDANISNGLWLHHTLIYAVGPTHSDTTCKDRDISVPHVIVGATARTSERLFASGNEKSPLIFPDASVMKVGYKLEAEDSLALLVDLMNTDMKDKLAYLTFTFDVVDGHHDDWDNLRPVWLDIAQCGTSELIPAQQSGKFAVNYTWTSTVEGEILGMAGHLHDGGTHLTLTVDNKPQCNSKATYAGSKEFVQAEEMTTRAGGKKSATKHISSMTACWGDSLPIKRMEKGQVWDMSAWYDLDKHEAVLDEEGDKSEVMGISLIYLKEKTKQ
jgi:hypothetical protein